jgi:hypothetical protein
MKIEDFIGSEVFWTAAAALVALSVAIGSLVTIGITAWVKHRERPEADWAVHMSGHAVPEEQAYGIEAGFHSHGRISNVGDGGAFQVELQTKNCRGSFSAEDTHGMPTAAYAPPGSVLGFHIVTDLDKWDSAEVSIVWTASPTRLKQQAKADLTPRNFMEKPGVTVTDPKSGIVTHRPLA